MSDTNVLGIFDSGLGGYSVLDALYHQGPAIHYVLYADQKHAPYGLKSKDEIILLAKQALQWFSEHGIQHVLLACNTVSANALEELNLDFPHMRIWGIIDLTISQLNVEENHLVLSTQATYDSLAYSKAWQGNPNMLKEQALKDLVNYIEGLSSEEEIRKYLDDEIHPSDRDKNFVLACTHYPLIEGVFQTFTSGKVYDSRKVIVDYFRGYFKTGIKERQKTIYTSGDPLKLKKQISTLFDQEEEVRGLE